MNKKEVRELRRRWKPEKTAVSKIYGCFVNSAKEIVADLEESLGLMPQEEAEKYLSLLKKTLSGALGQNLLDIVFSTQQVADSPEHKRLMTLKETGLQDGKARREFYETVIANLDMGTDNYLLLMAADTYDVPYKSKSGALDAESGDTVYKYFLCCVCPVKQSKPELGYFPGDNEFHFTASQVVCAPELGFLFPTFDDRASNIYNALLYAKKAENIHQEFIDTVFSTPAPLSSAEQREAFQSALEDALEGAASIQVAQSVHGILADRISLHKESGDPEPLSMTVAEIGQVLRQSGVSEEKVTRFQDRCREALGQAAALNPANLIDPDKFQVKTDQATVSVDPAYSHLVKTQTVQGRRYLLIPAEGEVEVNGVSLELRA